MSGVDGNLVLGVIVLGGGAFLAWKAGLFNPSASSQNNSQVTANTNAALSKDLAAQQAAGEQATLSSSQLSAMANQILSEGEPYPVNQVGSSQDDIVSELNQLQNNTDWILLQQAFGTPNLGSSLLSACNFIGVGCDATPLTTFLGEVLDSSHLASVNAHFSNQGINYQFPAN